MAPGRPGLDRAGASAVRAEWTARLNVFLEKLANRNPMPENSHPSSSAETRPMDRRPSPSRAGFTLVEVIVAILIIGILVALLLPAVQAAFRKAKEAQVSAELNNLATALASFKNTYGDYPPSRVILCESGYGSLPTAFLNATVGSAAATAIYPENPIADTGNDSDMTNQQLVQRSLLYMRRFWPRCDFNSTPNTNQVALQQFNDFNGDTQLNGSPIILSGSECLAFFLGGLPIIETNQPGLPVTGTSGFTKSPLYPFMCIKYNYPQPNMPVINNALSLNRTVANYEFNTSRLIDLDGDKIPSYLDPLNTNPTASRPYAYFTSYGTNSYDPNDDNGNGRNFSYEHEDDGTTIVERGFQVGFPVYNATATLETYCVSPGPNPYTSNSPIQTTGNVSWINPNSFQLFSAGVDGYWGLGGQYVQNSQNVSVALPIATSDPGIINSIDLTNGIRTVRETDNIANFAGGRLD